MKQTNNFDLNTIQPHEIIFALTSPTDYEMERLIFAEQDSDEYLIVNGYHFSCFDFDSTEWEATELTESELEKLISRWKSRWQI
jgi:hypothetical protein